MRLPGLSARFEPGLMDRWRPAEGERRRPAEGERWRRRCLWGLREGCLLLLAAPVPPAADAPLEAGDRSLMACCSMSSLMRVRRAAGVGALACRRLGAGPRERGLDRLA